MARHPRLFLRNSTYWHRAAIPLDIKSTYPKSEETFSLKTKDYQEALRRVRIAAAEVDARFAAHRERHRNVLQQPLTELSEEQISLIKHVYYVHLLEEDEETRLSGFYENDRAFREAPLPSFEEYEEGVADFSAITRHGYARGKTGAFFDEEAKEVLGWSNVNLTLNKGSSSWPKVARALQEATIRATGDIQARNIGDVVDTPARPHSPVRSTTSAPLLTKASERWLAEKERTWVEKTLKEHQAWLREFISFAGDRPIDTYRKDDASAFKAALLSLPANWSKHKRLGNVSMTAAAQIAADEGIQPMSTTNVNKILRFVGSFWIWAGNHYDDVSGDLFKGLQIHTKGRDVRDDRHPFSASALQRIFTAPIFTGCQSERNWKSEGGLVLRESGKFWIPLIGLFTGGRSGEIIQLTVEDVRNDDGILFLDLNTEGEDKRLKTANSKRKIPVHSELRRIGFASFVELRRRSGGGRLFPHHKLGADGYYSSPYSKYFNRFLSSVEVKSSKNAFHSFRHNFEDACMNAGVPVAVVNALQGHKEHGMAGRYGSGFRLDMLSLEIEKVRYPHLDLSHLYVSH